MSSNNSQVDMQLSNFFLDEKKFNTIRGGKNTNLSYIYDNSNYSKVKEKETDESFYQIQILRDTDGCELHKRYKNFVYIADNKPPFGKFRGYFQNESECHLYYKFKPKKTLQYLMENDSEEFLDDTTKSKTIFAVAAALEYCHALGIKCRFIHPESIFYDENKNPYLANFGYSDSILNTPNSTFNNRVVNEKKSLFQNYYEYISSELLADPNIDSFSPDNYAFGRLLKVLISRYEDKISNEIINISNNCLNNRCSSQEILENLVKISDPLFRECNMDKYRQYKKDILQNIYFTEDLMPFGDDERSLFVNSSRILNQNTDLDPHIKAKILQNLIAAANKNYIPAIYKLALFLDSNTDTFIYDVNSDPNTYDPILWMEKAAVYGVFKAPLLLGKMFERRGLFKESAQVYQKFNQNLLCKSKLLDSRKNEIKHALVDLRNKGRKIPEVQLETKMIDLIRDLAINTNSKSINNFDKKMNELSEKYKAGKPLYLLAILYRDGKISKKVLEGTDGFIPFSTNENEEKILLEYHDCKNNEKYENNLEIASNLLYEPAVAEYADLLLEKKNDIKEAEKLIDRFFSNKNWTNDCYNVKIQYISAKICEKKGLESNDANMIKKALHIYKDSADNGYIKSHESYLRLYVAEEDANPAIIKYYEQRKNLFE